MIFAHGFPVQAMPGNLLGKYEHAPLPVYARIKQRFGRYALPLNPPGIDLKQSNVKGLPLRLGLADNPHGFLPAGRVVIFARHIDGKRIQAGFLYADSLQQGRGRIFGHCRKGKTSQHKQQRNDSHHDFCLWICVERNANKQPRRAGQDVPWAYILCPVLLRECRITQKRSTKYI
jgi:hypothetical protein